MDDLQQRPVGPRNVNIENELSSAYIDYSMSVIVGRALPDARDGLKPVHRRVLFAMQELGNTHNSAYKKSARVVGDVIGKYHPHGDSAVYDTIVRMAQDFSMRYTLVDGQGNFGSRDGDAPAAMRYTEVRMARMAEELLADIEKDTVAFGPNYDESLQQPLVLPSKVPNLLLNGSTGIAVGMATNIPPHNLCELVDGITAYIDDPTVTVADLMEHIKGPDFPTEGIICGLSPIEQMYKTGRGQLRVRGRAHVEEMAAGRERILITELPYTVNKSRLIETIAELVQNKVIEGISDLRDESNQKEPVRVIVELKKGVIPDVVLNNLYKHTQMQMTFGANMLAIVDGRPKLMNLKELIECFVQHRFEVVTRRARFELAKAEARAHILEGLLKALDHIDEVVRIIRTSTNRDAAHTTLVSQLGLSDVQTRAILDMRLYQLTGLEREKLEAEFRQLQLEIERLKDLLAHEAKIYGVIKDELRQLREAYGDERRTELTIAQDDVNIEDLIADEPCVVTLSHKGYIKRVPLDTYREQRRGGKGVTGAAMKEEDFVETLFLAATHDTMLFFTSFGRVYAERAFDIPEAPRTSPGKAIVNLLQLQDGEKVAAMLRIREFRDDQHVFFATEQGVVKKTCLADYRNVRVSGINAINIEEGDHLIQVRLTGGSDEVMLTTANGMTIRFPEIQVRSMGRTATGVNGIDLAEGDLVCSLDVVDPMATFLITTANGYGKRTAFDEFRIQRRGGKGLIGIQTSERNGKVVSAHAVREDDSVMMMTATGMMVRSPVRDLRIIGRNTQGVRLINLDEGDQLVSATCVPPESEEPAPPLEGEGAGSPPSAE